MTQTITVFAFDVGSKYIGVAIGNTLTQQARPLGMRPAGDWDGIAEWVGDYRPKQFVIGQPLRAEHDTSEEEQPAMRVARKFAETLRDKHPDIPVAWMDERRTSKEAAKRFATSRKDGFARRKDAEHIDAIAAQIILERWFQQGLFL